MTSMATAVFEAVGGDTTIIAAPGATRRIAVYGWSVTVGAAAATASFEDGTGGTNKAAAYLDAAVGATWTVGPAVEPIFRCSVNTLLNLEMSAGAATGTVFYRIEEAPQ